jgi:predicted transcriptional regulator
VTDVQARETQTTLTLRLPAQLVARLEAFAALTGGSAASLVEEALIPFLDYEEWKYTSIAEAVNKADAGGPLIEHERVEAWVKSWGTDHELPRPT